MKSLLNVVILSLMCASLYNAAAYGGEAKKNMAAASAALQRNDYKTAFAAFSKAAAQGDAEAQFSLGLMYDTGRGVARDYLSAYMWFNIAGAGGYKAALKGRDRVAVKMTAEQIATARKMARDWLAKHRKP